MNSAIDTSLTLIDRDCDETVDATIMSDPERHFVIRSRTVGEALRRAVAADAPRRSFKVGGSAVATNVDFFVIDLKRDKAIRGGITRVIDDGFIDAAAQATKTAMGQADGLLSADATSPLDAVSEMIELRRFLSNAAVRTGARRNRELLFHHVAQQAAE